jgi:hypothetical protein
MQVSIYGLVDPRTNEIGYIGKTVMNLPKRLSYHVYEANTSQKNYHRLRWVRKILSLGMMPEIILLEEVPFDDWEWYETWWIKYGRVVGWDLTNGTSGGDGLHNPSQETRDKISRSLKGRKVSDSSMAKRLGRWTGEKNPNYGNPLTDEVKQKLRETMTGRTLSEQHIEKVRKANTGKKRTPEVCEKIKRALNTPEVKDKLSKSSRGKNSNFTEDQIIDIKKRCANKEKHKDIAKDYGVARTTITAINRGQNWSWLK